MNVVSIPSSDEGSRLIVTARYDRPRTFVSLSVLAVSPCRDTDVDPHLTLTSSDAFWQYLLVQYGFSPTDMKDANDETARVGDVLILPRWGFTQPLPQPNEWDITGPYPEKRAVCHSMLGRWRNSPLIM